MTTTLPQWDLSDLFSGFDDPKYLGVKDRVLQMVGELSAMRPLLEQEWDAHMLLKAMKLEEQISIEMNHYYAFAHMTYDVDTKNEQAKVEQGKAERLGYEVGVETEWFTQYLKGMTKEHIDEVRQIEPAYGRVLDELMRFVPYIKGEKEEQLLSAKDIHASSAWGGMHTEIAGHLDYGTMTVDGEEITLNQSVIKKYTNSSDREVRKIASEKSKLPFKDMIHIFGYVFRQVLGSSETDARDIRGYQSELQRAAMGDEVEIEHIDHMKAVVESLVPLYQQYYTWKKERLGYDTFYGYDMNAPLHPENKPFQFEDAKAIVLKTYENFDAEVKEKAEWFFDKRWIDARESGNKYAGAYSWAMEMHPYILLNYQPIVREVFTMIHELGHGVHSLLAREAQPYVVRSTSKVIAESASQFSELLLLDYIIEHEEDANLVESVLAHHVEDMMYSLISTITVTEFERQAHERSSAGGISVTELCDLWQELSSHIKGDVIQGDELDRYMWARIPHIFQTPFYYFTYPMSLFVVLVLYSLYKEDKEAFIPKYKQFLSYGSLLNPTELIKTCFDLEFGSKAFFERGAKVVTDFAQKVMSNELQSE